MGGLIELRRSFSAQFIGLSFLELNCLELFVVTSFWVTRTSSFSSSLLAYREVRLR